MEFDPPSAMTRFGMFFLAGSVAIIFAIWGVLNWIDKPRPSAPAKPAPVPTATPSVAPSPSPARPSPSAVPG